MSNYLKKLIVKPGSKVRLEHFDPSYHEKHEPHKSALPEIQKNLQKMEQLQYLMYAESKHSLLIVLQGLDFGKIRDAEHNTPPPVVDVRPMIHSCSITEDKDVAGMAE